MTRTVPVPLLAGLVFLAGMVLVAVLLAARSVNSAPSRPAAPTRFLPMACVDRACVPIEDAPYVVVRS